MMEELHRLNSEKKMLTEKLSRVNESYSALQNHFNQVLKTTNSQLDLSVVQSRKRKAENENCIATNNMFSFSGASECSTSTEDSFRRPKDPSPISHPISPKVSKVFVRTQASDPSLVSLFIMCVCACAWTRALHLVNILCLKTVPMSSGFILWSGCN